MMGVEATLIGVIVALTLIVLAPPHHGDTSVDLVLSILVGFLSAILYTQLSR
jgi:uncharacterized membrane protein YccC